MRRAIAGALLVLAAVAAGLIVSASRLSGLRTPPRAIEVTRGSLDTWIAYEGRIESRRVQTIQSHFDGSATVTSLAPEGIKVEPGTLLVTLDSSEIERSILRLERDVAVAQAELEGLQRAQHPLKSRELMLKVKEAESEAADEEQFLEDSRALAEEGLISDYQIRQQELQVEKALLRLASFELEQELTTNIVHRTELARARAKLEAAKQELELARRQLGNCRVRSPSAGNLVYLPLHVAGEYRTVRVGDSLFKNQPFLSVPDMSEPVVHCFVPESELSKVRVNDPAVVTPLAYTEAALAGTVDAIGSIARNQVGRPHWQKFFEVTVRLEAADPRLRYGMTAECLIRSKRTEDALRIPRTAVWWEDEAAYCHVVEGRRARIRRIRLGASDDRYLEVVDGLSAGEWVRVP